MTSHLDHLKYEDFLNSRHPSLMVPWMGAIHPAAGGAGAGGFAVDNSAMFNIADTEYLVFSNGNTPSNTDIGTISLWFKRGLLGAGRSNDQCVWSHGTGGSIKLQMNIGGGTGSNADTILVGNGHTTQPSAKFRDPHAWFHVVIRVDTSQSTEADRQRIYINGEQVTVFTSASYPSQNADVFGTDPWEIAKYTGNTVNGYDGYIAEFCYCDGQSLGPSAFGETDDNGVWRPKDPSSNTFGNNGFYLNMAASGSDLGDDASGNSNDFTNTNAVTQTTDSPTSNFATLTPIDTSPAVFSEGNLKVTSSTSNSYRGGTGSIGLPPGSGKWYVEALATGSTGSNKEYGFGAVTNDTNKGVSGYFPGSYGSGTEHGYYSGSGGIIYNTPNSSVTSVGTYNGGDRVALRFDMDVSSPTCKFYVNDTLKHTANLTAGKTYFPHFNVQDSNLSWTVNFGATAFTYSLPTDHLAINAANLNTALTLAIKDGTAHFQATAYSGTGSAREVNQSGNSQFQPDLVWVKKRNGTNEHRLVDAVRGATKTLFSDGPAAESTEATGVTSFDSDGFSVGTGGGYNNSSDTYVGWQWLAGNATSTPSGGSVSSTVSVNQTAGFSIVSWTGTGANATVAHGLGAAPSWILIKNLADADSWVVYHDGIGATKGAALNTSDAPATASTFFNDTAPTSTVFSVGSGGRSNGSSDAMIAYCWCEKAGFSKFGSFEGNGNANGPLIETGFKPSWIMVKGIDSSSRPWVIHDSARNPHNVTDLNLLADSNTAEASSNLWDFLSNGFKIRDGLAGDNENNKTHIYMAFAEHPFAGTTPATAR